MAEVDSKAAASSEPKWPHPVEPPAHLPIEPAPTAEEQKVGGFYGRDISSSLVSMVARMR